MKRRVNDKRDVRIKYLSFTYKGVPRRLPMVQVCLTHKGIDIPSTALIDSGATSTFIPLSLAKLLNLELKDPNNNVEGAGGSFSSYLTIVGKLTVLKINRILTDFDNLIVRVPAKDDGVPFVVLGRDSIFRKFDIKFQENLQQLHLQKIKKKAK